MQITVTKCKRNDDGELILDDITPCDIEVLQRNSAPSERPPDADLASPMGRFLPIWVPACMSCVTSQIDGSRYSELVGAYLVSLRSAKAIGAKNILFPALGTESLYWKHPVSVQAAKEAIDAFSEKNPEFSSGLKVVFAVEERACDEWQYVLSYAENQNRKGCSDVAVEEKEVGGEEPSS